MVNSLRNRKTLSRTAALPLALSILAILFGAAIGQSQPLPNSLSTHSSKNWEPDIAAFEASDRTNPPPKNGIVFVGSSSIRMWSSLKTDFPGLPVINRGFGGSQIADSVNFADRIILPYQPRQVVVYAGGNDLAEGKDPKLVYGDFVALVSRIQKALPHARVAFIASAPNPKRWAIVDKVRELNSLVANYCRQHDLQFIDVFPLMLGSDGLPKPDIFRDDRLHMNTNGYDIWKAAVAPYLK
jgi:lysophospholipase L1-like esterase